MQGAYCEHASSLSAGSWEWSCIWNTLFCCFIILVPHANTFRAAGADLFNKNTNCEEEEEEVAGIFDMFVPCKRQIHSSIYEFIDEYLFWDIICTFKWFVKHVASNLNTARSLKCWSDSWTGSLRAPVECFGLFPSALLAAPSQTEPRQFAFSSPVLKSCPGVGPSFAGCASKRAAVTSHDSSQPATSPQLSLKHVCFAYWYSARVCAGNLSERCF